MYLKLTFNSFNNSYILIFFNLGGFIFSDFFSFEYIRFFFLDSNSLDLRFKVFTN